MSDNKISVTLATSDFCLFNHEKDSFYHFSFDCNIISALIGCNGNKVAPVSERIAKVWTASKIDENNITVYTKGATNIRNYTGFKLDLSRPLP